MRNKPTFLNTLAHPFFPVFSPPPAATQRDKKLVPVSSSRLVSAAPSSSGTGLLILFPTMGSCFPRGIQVSPGACSSIHAGWSHSLLQTPSGSSTGFLPQAVGQSLLPCAPPWAQRHSWLTMVCSTACRGISALGLEYLPLLHRPWYLQSGSSHIFSLLPSSCCLVTQ